MSLRDDMEASRTYEESLWESEEERWHGSFSNIQRISMGKRRWLRDQKEKLENQHKFWEKEEEGISKSKAI